jgi:hypothetical protein
VPTTLRLVGALVLNLSGFVRAGVVPIAPLAGRPRSAGWLRSPGRLFGRARTIAANAAYPSVGHIPLRRELDDATGMGAERLIIDGKARTASASRDALPFPLWRRESGLLGSQSAHRNQKHGFEATEYTLRTDQLGTQLDPPAHWAPGHRHRGLGKQAWSHPGGLCCLRAL